MKLHAKEDDNEYLQNANIKSYWHENEKKEKSSFQWERKKQNYLISISSQYVIPLTDLEIQAFYYTDCTCWHLQPFLIMKMEWSMLYVRK